MRSIHSIAACLLSLSSVAWAQSPSSQPGGGKVLQLKNMTVDLEKRHIVIRAEVCQREAPLEFLLCRNGVKEHETILRTEAQPSDVHAALLALGLTPGVPAHGVSVEGETEARRIPPQGALLRIQFRWKDAAGKEHEADPSEWMQHARDRKAPIPKRWVFVGSQVLPNGSYWADENGELISVSNFASSVIDVPFESTDKDAELEFLPNKEAIPEPRTPVEVVITPEPLAEKADRARVMLEIDRFGRLRIDGRGIAASQLTDWATKYVERHARGQVFLRVDPLALAYDVEQAKELLRLGGVRDFEEQRLAPAAELPPRTTQQAADSLKEWADRFQNARDQLVDPALDAEGVLEQVRERLRDMEQMRKVLADYAAKLEEAKKRYELTTRPAGPETPSAPGAAAPHEGDEGSSPPR